MGERAAHHANVAGHGDRLKSKPRKDARVGVVVEVVGAIEASLITVGAVGVLHRELAHANESAARAWLVAPLRLEVIHLLWELAPRVDQLAKQVGHYLFVRHRQDHVTATTIVEAAHLWADLVVAPSLAPEVGRVHDRHQHLLRTDRIHLFTDHLGDAHVDAHAEWEERVDSSAQRPNVASAQQEAVRGHLRVGGVLPKGREEEFTHAHEVNPTRARGSRSGGGCESGWATEDVADPANRLKGYGLGRDRLHGLTQGVHMHVNRARFTRIVVAPHLVEELLS